MKKPNKLESAYSEIMRELYKSATPSADFDELVDAAPLDRDGRKVIPFDDYEIPEKVAKQIFDDAITKYKVRSKYNVSSLSMAVWLGASPRFTKE